MPEARIIALFLNTLERHDAAKSALQVFQLHHLLLDMVAVVLCLFYVDINSDSDSSCKRLIVNVELQEFCLFFAERVFAAILFLRS